MKTRCPAEVRIYCQASDSGVPSRSDGGFAETDSVGRRRKGSEKGDRSESSASTFVGCALDVSRGDSDFGGTRGRDKETTRSETTSVEVKSGDGIGLRRYE